MKLKIVNLSKTETSSMELPLQFYEPVREDLIRKAFLVIQSNKRQPYGSDPEAGKKSSAEVSRRRRDYRGSYGLGISRVPRKVMSRRGTRMNWVGAFAPGTVGGRRAHPPKVTKVWSKNINKQERRKAIRSAIAATIDLEAVKKRGHAIPHNYPFVVSDELEKITQTKKLVEILSTLGFKEELESARQREKKGLLIVTSKSTIRKACLNIPGFESEKVSNLNVEVLAPGGSPGRLTIFTESAVKELAEKKLFTSEHVAVKVEKKQKAEAQPKAAVQKPKKEAAKPAKTIKKTEKKADKQ